MSSKHNTPRAPGGISEHAARWFVAGLAILLIVVGGVFSIVGYLSGPPIGDLTRISGLSERDYGWEGETSGFAQNHFAPIRLSDLMAGKGQNGIVVFGDSFSAPQEGNITWTNTLHALSGRPIDLVDINSLADIKAWFMSDSFQTNPPEAVIIEIGERTLFRRARGLMDGADCSPLPAPARLEMRPRDVARTIWTRRKDFNGFDELMSWGALSLRLRLLADSKTVAVDLDRGDLFSSATPDRLLIYHSDILRHTLPEIVPYDGPRAEQAVICALRDMIHASAGHAPVYVTLAPDKRSVYERWIITKLEPKAVRFLEILPDSLSGHYIDLYTPLMKDAQSAITDVYFPNDTHWSAHTHARIGRIIAHSIGDKG